MQPVQLGGGPGRAPVVRQRPDQGRDQPAGQGVEPAVGHGQRGGRGERGQPGVQPGGGGPPVGEPQGARQAVQQFAQAVVDGGVHPGLLGLGHGPAGVQQPYGALQHPGPGQLDLGGAFLGLQECLEQRREAAGQQEEAVAGGVDETQPGEVVEGGLGGGHGAAGQGGGGVRVDGAGRGERQQPQGPLGGLRQGLVDEPEAAGERAAGGGWHVVQLLGHVGDGGLGVGGEPSADEDERGGLAPALLGEGLGGPGVGGDPGVADALDEQLHGGGGVESAEGAGPDVGDAGEGALGGDHDEALGGVRQQGVHLLGVDGVVDQDDGPAAFEGGAQGGAQLVLAGSGRGGPPQSLQQAADGPLGGHGRPAGGGEPGAEHSVGVLLGDLLHEGLGEGRAPGPRPPGDEQHPGPGRLGLAAGEGVESGSRDVLAQLLELTPPPDEIRHGSAPLPATGLRA